MQRAKSGILRLENGKYIVQVRSSWPQTDQPEFLNLQRHVLKKKQTNKSKFSTGKRFWGKLRPCQLLTDAINAARI